MRQGEDLQAIYARRYGPGLDFHDRMWRVLCRDFMQQHVPPGRRVLELGAGHCGFVNHIEALEKTAVDLNPDVRQRAAPGVRFVLSPVTDLSACCDNSMDVVFASNLFEHLERRDIVKCLREVSRVLAPGGRFLILQPNIRFCGRDYWMFFDHITPLDDRSMSEALETNGFSVREAIPRFLPYTTKSRLPKSIALLRIYLRAPVLWRLLGGQFFLVAEVRKKSTQEQPNG